MKKIFSIVFPILIMILMTEWLVACSASMDTSEAYHGESPQQIFQAGKEALQNNNYTEAMKRFEALDVQYPFGQETEKAQLFLIYVYYMKEDYALSVVSADRFIRMHPVSADVDYAFYMRGVSNYYENLGLIERIFSIDLATRDLAQIRKSYYDFSELIGRFPDSRYAPSAHQYLVYLRNVLATHELQVGNYYYHRRAFMAAANRGANLVAHYQGAPAVVDGLILMAKSYHMLGLTKLENDTLKVLAFNYPGLTVEMPA